MTIFQYIKKYGNYSFNLEPFNEVDNVVLSFLTYLDFFDFYEQEMTLQQLGNVLLNNSAWLKKMKKDIMAVRGSVKLLKAVYRTKRYGALNLLYCEQDITEKSQFFAVTFRFPNGTCYVAFEGTDAMISGWREDLELAIRFPVDAHKKAIAYLNHHFTFEHSSILVGGHSKGGHLALVSAMYTNFLVRRKIKKIYNNDGPGLLDFVYSSNLYDKVKDRYIHLIPNYALVGILLNNDSDYEVVASSRIGIEAHYALYWIVEENHFKRTKLSKFSEVIERSFTVWLSKYSLSERQQFVNDVFLVFEQNNITNLVDIKQSFMNTLKFIRSSVGVSNHVKFMIKDLISILNHEGFETLEEKERKELQ